MNVDEKEAARTLQSLACGKVRVLQKIPKGREVADTDEFAFNTVRLRCLRLFANSRLMQVMGRQEFKDDHIKIKINQIQQKETVRHRVTVFDLEQG